MPILEKITNHHRRATGLTVIPLEYHYTAGVAGEEFSKN